MKTTWGVVLMAAALAACGSGGGSVVAANCQRVFVGDEQADRLLEFYSTDSDSVCGCLDSMLAALPEDRQLALGGGLAEMLRVKDEKSLDMEAVYTGFQSGEHSLEGKVFTVEDLSEMGELLEDAAENIGDDDVCDVG